MVDWLVGSVSDDGDDDVDVEASFSRKIPVRGNLLYWHVRDFALN